MEEGDNDILTNYENVKKVEKVFQRVIERKISLERNRGSNVELRYYLLN